MNDCEDVKYAVKLLQREDAKAESVFSLRNCGSSHRSRLPEQIVGKSVSCTLRIRVPVIAGIWVVPRAFVPLCDEGFLYSHETNHLKYEGSKNDEG